MSFIFIGLLTSGPRAQESKKKQIQPPKDKPVTEKSIQERQGQKRLEFQRKLSSWKSDAEYLAGKKEFLKAIKILEQILDLEPYHEPTILKIIELYGKLGLPDQVEKYYRQLLTVNPLQPQALFHLGKRAVTLLEEATDFSEDKFQKGLQYLHLSLRSLDKPENLEYENLKSIVHFTLAKAYYLSWVLRKKMAAHSSSLVDNRESGRVAIIQLEKNIEYHFERALGLEPLIHESYSYLARYYFQQGQYKNGLDQLKAYFAYLDNKCTSAPKSQSAVKEKCPAVKDLFHLELFAKINAAVKNQKEEIAAWLEVIKQNGLHREANLALGRYYLTNKDYDQAKIYLNIVREEYPDSPGINRDLGDIYFSYMTLENFKKALSYYKTHVAQNPQDYPTMKKLGLLLYKINYLEAFPYLDKLYALNPLDPEITILYADHAMGRREYLKALYFYQKYQTIRPWEPDTENKIGNVYLALGDQATLKKKWHKAIEQYKKYQALFPKNKNIIEKIAGSYKALAEIHFTKKAWLKSLQYLEQSEKIRPSQEDVRSKIKQIFLNLAQEKFQLKDWPLAIGYYEKYLKLEPQDKENFNKFLLAKKNQGNYAFSKGSFQEAISYLRDWQKEFAQDIEISYQIAQCQKKLGKFVEEKDELENILRIKQDHLPSLEELIFLYYNKIHDLERLVQLLENTLKYFPKHPDKKKYQTLLDNYSGQK